MALQLPVFQEVNITAAQSYIETIALCTTNVSSSFVAAATPVFSSSAYTGGFQTTGDSATSTILFMPGDRLQYVTSTRTASTETSTQYPVFAVRNSATLSCSRTGTAVIVTIPFGTTYSQVSDDETSLDNSPSKYTYAVYYGESGPTIVTGTINVNIKTTSSVSEFSVCKVSVT